ncbi:MAG: TldD/PmbA family protein [Proteobacteria bacterium]|nr:TldD/PmbA family protein [Pseudomonadota bacterium]
MTETATQPLELLSELIEKTKQNGAEAADAIYMEGRSLSVSWRLGKSEGIEHAEAAEVGLRALIGKKQAIASSTDLSGNALDELARRVPAMAKSVPDDPFCGLADKALLARAIPDLELLDSAEPTPERLMEMAAAAEDAARAVEGITNSEGAGAGFGASRVALATSDGFAGEYSGTNYSVSASVLAGEGTHMERDYDYAQACFLEDLEAPEAIGRRAGERAVKRLEPRKVASQQIPVVYDQRVAGGLLRHFARAINGAAIARGTSFLKDSLDKPVFAKGIRITDDPRKLRGLRSRPFDGEGVATGALDLIEDGRLTSWLLESRSARQLKLVTKGHAGRGVAGLPAPGVSNLYLNPGEASPAELIADIDQGFLVTELIGMGVNGVTGDYSRGAGGFWIEKGELTGNLKEMFARALPANDLAFRYGIDAPTVRIDGMTLAGA